MEVYMKREIIHVSTGRPYDIIVENGLLRETGALAAKVTKARNAAVITDTNVAPLFLEAVKNSLEEAGFSVKTYIFPAGETSKNHKTLIGIYEFLAQNGFNRSDVIIALGGGVVGDVAGFAAATFMRGMDFIQVPTTLLAQIDSSIGGKTAVDLCEGKNLVGAFWQPRLVICDPDTLKTLDKRIFADGMAEAIKHTLIKDRTLFERLCDGMQVDAEFICRNIDIKRRVVERDERESGERMLLNFGHTLGHAIEKVYNYEKYTHGEAVAIGMVTITQFAERRGLTKPGTASKIARVIEKNGLPVSCDAPLSEILKAAKNDKKRSAGGITLVLLHDIGEGYLYRVSDSEFNRFFSEVE
jgi:3-dehydroquinate synthase (EC 4.2.3.4)